MTNEIEDTPVGGLKQFATANGSPEHLYSNVLGGGLVKGKILK